jgi:hypothetical protein
MIIIGGRYYTVPCITEGMTKINEHARSRVLLEKLIAAHVRVFKKKKFSLLWYRRFKDSQLHTMSSGGHTLVLK